jgi:hypothetical protein
MNITTSIFDVAMLPLCGNVWLKRKKYRMSLSYKFVYSPIGKLKLVTSEKELVGILWEKDRPGRVRLSELSVDAKHPVLLETEEQLPEYLSGQT